MPDESPAIAQHDDADPFLGGTLRLRQSRGGHRVGTDAVLLATAARADFGRRIVDLGAGVGAVGLALAIWSPETSVDLIEIDPEAAALARVNIALNGVDGRCRAIEADIAERATLLAAGLRPATIDLVVANPPFHPPGSRPSPDPAKTLARLSEPGAAAAWIGAAAWLLARGGRLVLIHRPEALAELLQALSPAFGAVAIRPVHARADQPAIRMLIRAVKGRHSPPTLEPALVLHEADGAFTPQAQALHRGTDGLRWSTRRHQQTRTR